MRNTFVRIVLSRLSQDYSLSIRSSSPWVSFFLYPYIDSLWSSSNQRSVRKWRRSSTRRRCRNARTSVTYGTLISLTPSRAILPVTSLTLSSLLCLIGFGYWSILLCLVVVRRLLLCIVVVSFCLNMRLLDQCNKTLTLVWFCIWLGSAPCASYLLRKRALYNDMSRYSTHSDRSIPVWFDFLGLKRSFFYLTGTYAALVTCRVVAGVEKPNVLNFVLPLRWGSLFSELFIFGWSFVIECFITVSEYNISIWSHA